MTDPVALLVAEVRAWRELEECQEAHERAQKYTAFYDNADRCEALAKLDAAGIALAEARRLVDAAKLLETTT